MGMSSMIDEQVVTDLTRMLHECNPYVRTFRSLREWAHDNSPATPYHMVIHADRRPAGEHVRRYNGPEASEVAALIPGNKDGTIGRRDVVSRRRGELNTNGNELLDTISVSHRSYDPLSYVLLFPDGRDGWHLQRSLHQSRGRNTKVSPLMFYSWQLFERPTREFSTILHACSLFQQYLFDRYCKVEAERLSYLRQNQQRFRAADYTNLRQQLGDSGRGEDETEAVRAGRLFILPSTHVGGDRYMRQQMHDIIAISNKIGHPDIFLTMTCNPKWREIVSALLPGQKPADRPDLCARVFKLKLQVMMDTVIEKKVFGSVIARVRVIKFQKRGLPHAHAIFFLEQRSKHDLRNPENVDRIISAEIPAEFEDAELRELVLKQMIRTPCGEINPGSPYLGEKGCKKFFPKKFLNETSQSENDYYVQYRRRPTQQGGESVEREIIMGRRRQGVMVDNSWVVPHNRKLLRMFACHINVELCISRVGGIKYLFKYVCKGSDRVTMKLIPENQRYDKIKMFQDARYVSTSEAAWRLLSFNIVHRSPNVVRLDVHLENHHTLIFEEGEEHDALARSRLATKMTEWFTANQNYPCARHILYQDYCRYFTWNAQSKTWKPRARLRRRNASSDDDRYDFSGAGVNVVGRIYTVSPREGERYILRLLLTHKPGATSFEDLRTIDGEVYNSCRQACYKTGILADDDEWKRALLESFQTSFMPFSHVFATILMHCTPSDPRTLWDEHEDMFRQDIRARARGPRNNDRREQLSKDVMASSYALQEIQEFLEFMGSSSTLQDFELPQPPNDLPPILGHDSNFPLHTGSSRETNRGKFEDIVRTSLPLLNERQRQAFDKIIGSMLPGISVQSILRGDSSNAAASSAPATPNRVFFLDAPGGTGKIFLINVIQASLELRNFKVLPVATSAVAAGLLMGERTAPSTFKIPIPALEDATCNISANSQLAKRVLEVSLIIWDEVVMCHRLCIETVDRTLRDLTGTDLPFGGKFVVFSEDFRQVLPVIPSGSRAQIVNGCIKSFYLFDCCTTLRLIENMRLQALRNDPSADQEAVLFPEFFLRVREGRVRSQSLADPQFIHLPTSVTFETSFLSMCRNIFSQMAKNYTDIQWLSSRAILTTKNIQLTVINTYVGDMIFGRYRTYLSADKVNNEDKNALRYPVDMLNLLTAGSALPEHSLKLKNGFTVMLLRNMDPENGYANGQRYIIENMSNHLLYLRVATGSYAGQRFFTSHTFGPGDDNFPVPGFTRTQFFVGVCFGLTTNKAQGQSFGGKLGLDLQDMCFSHGQLYVANYAS